MNRRKFLGIGLKAAAVAPVAGVVAVISTPDDPLAKGTDIPLTVPERDLSVLVDGVALISNNKVIARANFHGRGRAVIPGDELTTHWTVRGHVGNPPVRVSDEYARRLALEKMKGK